MASKGARGLCRPSDLWSSLLTCLAERWARARGALQGQWLCACGGTLPGAVPTVPVTCWQAVTRAALGCPGAMPGGLCCGSVVQAEQADPSCGGGAQSAGVMPSWRHKKQEKAEVTRSKKTWCLGLGGGQPPAGERL